MACVKKLKMGSLAEDMRQLLETGEGADLVLRTIDGCLSAHRAVLSARSPVFAAMFHSDMRESREALVDIDDVGMEVLRKLLHFVYTDEVPELDGVAGGLLSAADKYQLLSLKETCEEWLLGHINIDDAAAIAVVAVTHDCTQLKKSIITYMKNHYFEIIGTKGWEEAMRKCVDASVEICKLISAEAANECRCSEVFKTWPQHKLHHSTRFPHVLRLLWPGFEHFRTSEMHKRGTKPPFIKEQSETTPNEFYNVENKQ